MLEHKDITMLRVTGDYIHEAEICSAKTGKWMALNLLISLLLESITQLIQHFYICNYP